jgi:putative ABC transport system substrate-binding protein
VLGSLAGVALAPVAVRAQPARTYRLGLLGNNAAAGTFLTDPLFAALKQHGWVVGRNLQVESRSTEGDHHRATGLARELIEQRVDVIVTVTTGNAVAARQVTSTVPIVMLGSGYPVEAGLAKSLANPGGNVTGVSIYAGTEIWGKYVSLARELEPALRRLHVLFDYVVSDKELDPLLAELRGAERAMKVEVLFRRHMNPNDVSASLSALEKTEHAALLATSGPVHAQSATGKRIGGFALEHRLPMINDVASGLFLGAGLLAYSLTPRELADRCASMIDRILRGARPGSMPIEYPTRFELAINMKTARALRLTVPQSLLLRADRVID